MSYTKNVEKWYESNEIDELSDGFSFGEANMADRAVENVANYLMRTDDDAFPGALSKKDYYDEAERIVMGR